MAFPYARLRSKSGPLRRRGSWAVTWPTAAERITTIAEGRFDLQPFISDLLSKIFIRDIAFQIE
jgi:hypothetical protein